MSKYTKGPWTSSGTEVYDEKQRDPIACCLYRDFDISVANAKLIAAAPDLLEALQALLERLQLDGEAKAWFPKEQDDAIKAIAKALA